MREKEARRAAREAKRRKAEESEEEEEESPSNEITEQPTLERFNTFLKNQQEFI